MAYDVFDKECSGGAVTRAQSEILATWDKSCIKIENMSNQQLTEEIHKPVIRKFGKSILYSSLRNSGAKYVNNEMPRWFQNFPVCLGNASAKILRKTQQEPLYILSAMASACLSIFLKAMIWFFNSWDYLFYLNYIIYS